MQCIGLDLGNRTSVFTVVSEAGKVIENGSTKTTRAGLRKSFAKRAPATICLEVGTVSPWVSRLLTELGHEVVACNPRRLKMIAESTLKTDRLDSEVLARLGRLAWLDPELLSRVKHRSEATQRGRSQLQVRHALVQSRTRLINTARGLARSLGHPLPSCSSDRFGPRVRESAGVPDEVKALLEPLLRSLDALNEQVGEMDARLASLAENYPVVTQLRTIPGVGLLTALSFVLCIEDPGRFRRSRDVGPYLGLRPTLRESSSLSQRGPITKQGDAEMRRMLTQAAHTFLRSAERGELYSWALDVRERRGRQKGVVALSRKLAVLMHRLWVTGATYEPFHQTGRLGNAGTAA